MKGKMTKVPIEGVSRVWQGSFRSPVSGPKTGAILVLALAATLTLSWPAAAQEDQLNKVHVDPPASSNAPTTGASSRASFNAAAVVDTSRAAMIGLRIPKLNRNRPRATSAFHPSDLF